VTFNINAFETVHRHMAFKFVQPLLFCTATAALSLLQSVAFANPAPSIVVSQAAPKPNTAPAKPATTAAPKIQLTAQQVQQLQVLRSEALTKIDGVLSPQQRSQLSQGLKSGKKLPQILPGLKLTAEQNKQIKSILEAFNTRVAKILTPDQLRRAQQ
jgi:Spy/CpxP family protein refolding chaperone